MLFSCRHSAPIIMGVPPLMTSFTNLNRQAEVFECSRARFGTALKLDGASFDEFIGELIH